MIDAASSEGLSEALAAQLMETEGRVERLQHIGELLGVSVAGRMSWAMRGLIEEAGEHLRSTFDPQDLLDLRGEFSLNEAQSA